MLKNLSLTYQELEMLLDYQCKNCNWTGPETELQFETVEGCFGDDKLEICPKCGSENVFIVNRH